MEKLMCYFLDRNDVLQFIREDATRFVVRESRYELECTFPLDPDKPISEGMKIGFYDIDGDLQFYEVIQPEEDHLGKVVSILAEHSAMAEMLDDQIIDVQADDCTAEQAAISALSGAVNASRWTVHSAVETETASCHFWYTSCWQAMKLIEETWNVSVKYSWVIDDNGIAARNVDILSSESVNRGKRFDAAKDVSKFLVRYDDSSLATALIGRGADISSENGQNKRKLSFADVVWSIENGDPADKPAGQEWIEDSEATELYGRSGRMRLRTITIDGCVDPEELLLLTWKILQRMNRPSISVRMTVADMEQLYGYSHEKVRMNDTVAAIADETNAEIETVVNDIQRDYIYPERTVITLGSQITETADAIYAEVTRATQAEETINNQMVEYQDAGTQDLETVNETLDTHEEMLIEFASSQSDVYSSIYVSSEELRTEFTDSISDLHSQIYTSAEELRTEFAADDSNLYSVIEQTASGLMAEFGNTASDLYSSIEVTAESLHTEFQSSNSAIYSNITQTAEGLMVEFGNSLSDTYSAISVSAEEIRTELYTSESSVYSIIQQTADGLEVEFGNSISDVYSSISVSASEIRTEIHTSQSSIYSEIVQTASGLKAEFGDSISGVYATISASASEIRTEIHTSESSIYSEIKQTASSLKAEFGNSISGVYSSISASASSIRSELHTSESSIYSEILQTASQIRSEVGSTISSVYSSISQQADRISLVVEGTGNNAHIKPAEIVAAINDAGSTIKISADHILLDGTTVAGYLDAQELDVGDFTCDDITASGDANFYGNVTIDGQAVAEGGFYGEVYVGNNVAVSGAVASFGTPTSSNGVISIPYSKLDGSTGTINFNIADTQFYQDSVSAIKSAVSTALGNAGWNSSTYSTQIYATLDTTNKMLTINQAFANISYPGDQLPTQVSVSIGNLDLTSALDAYASAQQAIGQVDGWDLAYGKVTPPGQGTDTSFAVQVPDETYNTAHSYTFTIQKGATPGSSGYASVALSGVVVGRIAIGDWYDAGVTAGEAAGKDAVTINKGSWNQGIISFTKSVGAASTKSVQLTAASASWSGNSASVQIWDGTAADAQHGSFTGYTVTVDASARYTAGETAGKNAVTITKGSWSQGIIQFTKSEGTASTKSVQLCAASPSWNGNTATVQIWDGTAADAQHGSNTGYTVTVTAPDQTVYYWEGGTKYSFPSGGKRLTNGVDIMVGTSTSNRHWVLCPSASTLTGTWSGTGNTKTYTLTGSNVTTKTVTFTGSSGSWSGNSRTITVSASDNSDPLFQYTITAPSASLSSSWSSSGSGTLQHTYTVSSASSSKSITIQDVYYLELSGNIWASGDEYYQHCEASLRINDGGTTIYKNKVDCYGGVDVTAAVNYGKSMVSNTMYYWENGNQYTFPSGGKRLTQGVDIMVGTSTSNRYWVLCPSGGGGGTIDIPSTQIYTTSSAPSGATKLNVLRNRFIEAMNDSDFVVFRVDCGSSQKWYYMEP